MPAHLTHEATVQLRGPWSLRTSRRFWEEFTPAAIPSAADPDPQQADAFEARFLSDHDWTPTRAQITQDGSCARIRVSGSGDLEAAARQVARFLSIDVDGSDWPLVGERDPVIGRAQRALPGFRPCGFYSPYEAACWCVLSQRTRVPIAARLRRELTERLGADGCFPSPAALQQAIRRDGLELPGRKAEYLSAVADAALDGVLDADVLRALPEDEARDRLRAITGIGPFAADLILVRGANSVDVLPRAERRLEQEVAHLYGDDACLADVSEAWRPFRSWAAVHLRALREERMHELGLSCRPAAGA
jgi:DNA-3-methyladenine glycosylase II